MDVNTQTKEINNALPSLLLKGSQFTLRKTPISISVGEVPYRGFRPYSGRSANFVLNDSREKN